MIGRTNVGGGSVRININNYTVLPVNGRQNDIALINNVAINNIYIQPTQPTPSEGDVWVKSGWDGNVYLQYGIVKVPLTTCKQYVSGAWTVITEWYVFTTQWTRARLYLIQDGSDVGAYPLSVRRWSIYGLDGLGGSGSVVTYNQGSSYALVSYSPSTSTNGTYGAGGICTANFNAAQYSKICLDIYQNGRVGYLSVNASDSTYANTTGYAVFETISTGLRRLEEFTISQTDTPMCVFFGVQSYRNDGWITGTARIYNLYLE